MIGERDIGPRERLARGLARYYYLRTLGTRFGDALTTDERHAHELSHFAKVERARAWLSAKPDTNVLQFPVPAFRRHP